MFKIESPMDATAILMVAAAKADGDLTKESKSQLLSLFEQEFGLSKKDAAGLLISSSHLLADGAEVRNNVRKFLAPSKDAFTEHQISSAVELIETVAGVPAERHLNAEELINKINQAFEPGT